MYFSHDSIFLSLTVTGVSWARGALGTTILVTGQRAQFSNMQAAPQPLGPPCLSSLDGRERGWTTIMLKGSLKRMMKMFPPSQSSSLLPPVCLWDHPGAFVTLGIVLAI